MLMNCASIMHRCKDKWRLLIWAVVFTVLLYLDGNQLVDRVLDWRIRYAASPEKRIVLLNMSLSSDHPAWNSRYIAYCSIADSREERELMADIIRQRYKERSIQILHDYKVHLSSSNELSNVEAVLSLID